MLLLFVPAGLMAGGCLQSSKDRQIDDLDTPEDLRQESDALTRSLDTTGAGATRTATFARRADARALTRATMDLADRVNRVILANRRLAKATGAAG